MSDDVKDDKSDSVTEKSSDPSAEAGKPTTDKEDVDLDLEEDVEAALGEDDAPSGADPEALLNQVAPEAIGEIGAISSQDFEGVIIGAESVSDPVDENSKVPSFIRALIQNLPFEVKKKYLIALVVIVLGGIAAVLVLLDKVLPRFELPYKISMHQLSKVVYPYTRESYFVPLFDEFKIKSFSYKFPKTSVTLTGPNGKTAFGHFEFILNLRDEEASVLMERHQSELVDKLQRALEMMDTRELQSPIGKEKLKKLILFKINEFMQGNFVIGVYFRSILIDE